MIYRDLTGNKGQRNGNTHVFAHQLQRPARLFPFADARLVFREQVCLRPRDRFWDIPVPKIDSAFDNLLVPQPSWSPSTTQQLRKLVAAPYLAPNDWTPRSEAYFVGSSPD
ncbi:hypothetical protein [Thiolapillus sp.]|uniref:hypothetical protein n=1 Tax=Thiolapillus sp. TaxID=2017437 RepID=UPI0025EB0767|nr:hypothetical protein [Thiolapillus sp.]